MMRAVVLFSGGQDSTTCLYLARAMYGADSVHALSVHYGQRHKSELVAARSIAAAAGVGHTVIELPVFGDALPLLSDAPIAAAGGSADVAAPAGLPTSFVPARNLVFLSVAVAAAARLGAPEVWTGVCEADYSGYPDCRGEFVRAFERAAVLALPSSTPVSVTTPLMHLSKAQTVALARGIPGAWDALALSVTCYLGQRPGCGTCPACVLRARGFKSAGFTDPAME